MNFHSDYSIDAIWSIPTNNEVEFFGKLSYSQDKGIEVEVFGSFFGTTSLLHLKNGIEENRIIGISKNGERLTLVDCLIFENGSRPGLFITKIYAKFLLKGHLYLLNNSSNISGINAHLPLLDKWFDIKSSFNYKHSNKYRSISIKYNQPKSKKLFENEEFSVYIYFSMNTQYGSKSSPNTSITQRAFLNIEFKEKKNLLNSVDLLIYVKRVFTLFTMFDVRFNDINIFAKIEEELEEFKLLFKDEGRYNLQPGYSEVLIYYSEINKKFPSVLKKWITKREIFEDILGYFFDIKHRLVTNQKNIFLNLCFSLERLHTTFSDKQPFNSKKVNTLKSILNKNTPKEFRQRLNDVMMHFNELSFSQRLAMLINKNHTLVSLFLYNTEKFIKAIKKTRNSYVHKTDIKKAETIPLKILVHYNNAMILILEISLLSEMKIPNEIIKKFINRDFGFRHIKENLPK